jgi:hypothetical protein
MPASHGVDPEAEVRVGAGVGGMPAAESVPVPSGVAGEAAVALPCAADPGTGTPASPGAPVGPGRADATGDATP